ncbi:unnamed protein product [Closterium sp. NIES-54]
MFSIDLKSGYHHVDIHPSCWKYLGFRFDGKTYVFRSLPFGLVTAPFVFTQLIKQLARRWRAMGIRVIPYVDDILFLCDTEAKARATCQSIIHDLNKAGLVINSKKSHLQPTQQLRFLGVELDTDRGQFSIGAERRASLLSTLQVLLREGKAEQGPSPSHRQSHRHAGIHVTGSWGDDTSVQSRPAAGNPAGTIME